MDKKELQEKYKTMEDEELIEIVTVDKNDYTPEAVGMAKLELTNRNIDIKQQTAIANNIFQKREQERHEIEGKHLTNKQKVCFILFPAIAFFYSIFVPEGWIKRRKEAFKMFFIGLLFWFGLRVLLFFIL